MHRVVHEMGPIKSRRVIAVASKKRGASAFLVRSGSRIWLVSCAHTFTGRRHSSTDWHTWGKKIEVFETTGRSHKIPLFGSKMRPLFSWVPAASKVGFVEDVIAIPLGDEASYLADYQISEMGQAVTEADKEQLSFLGYPGFGLSYPAIPEVAKRTGAVTGSGFNYLKLSIPSEEGFSGGPAFAREHLIGVVSGTIPDTNEALIVDLSAIGTRLFQNNMELP